MKSGINTRNLLLTISIKIKTMSTIDLNEVKKFYRVLSGKEKPESRYAKKLRDILGKGEHLFYFRGVYTFVTSGKYRTLSEEQANVRVKKNSDLQIYVSNCPGELLAEPKIFRGRRLNKYMIQNTDDLVDLIFEKTGVIVPESELVVKPKNFQAKAEEEKRYLFWYTVWTFIENNTYSTLSETEVENRLKQYPKMDIYYCRLVKSSDRTPAILKGRKIEKLEIHGYEELSELIYQKSGVLVPESDLMTKKDKWSLGVRAMAFMKEVEEKKEYDEDVQRIYKCLLENDPRKRKDCLNYCKIK